ncbi:MAG: hypothetical protein KDE46_19865 [Caldilineaceae bacterium]|nr:hypothetical protein [Caldilineaceae bacterium]
MPEKETPNISADILELLAYCEALKKWYAEIQNRDYGQGANDVLDKITARLEPIAARVSGLASVAAVDSCPVCGSLFEQNTGRGKKRIYCSNACKQKKIRQKDLDAKRNYNYAGR